MARVGAMYLLGAVLLAAHLTPAADSLFYERTVKPMIGQEADELSVAAHTASFHRWASVLDAHLAGQEYVVLGHLTCADISISSALMSRSA